MTTEENNIQPALQTNSRGMDKHLRPIRFDCDPSLPTATKKYKHWYRTFTNFLEAMGDTQPDRLNCLINYISSDIFEYITDCVTYEDAIQMLESIFVKPVNDIYSRHVLATRCQAEGENLDQYLQTLKLLSKDCTFQDVTAEENRQQYIRDKRT